MYTNILNKEGMEIYTGLAAVMASVVAGMACIGPMAGVILGLGGLGWMSQYAFLTMPAALVSLTLTVVSLYLFFSRLRCCANKRLYRLQRYVLLGSAFIVIGINVIEFVVIPNL